MKKKMKRKEKTARDVNDEKRYRIEGCKQSIKLRRRREEAMQGPGGDEPKIERGGRIGDHAEGVLDAHEKQQPHCEDTGYPMVPRHVHGIL